MLEITGAMCGTEAAVEYLEMLPDNIPDEIKDEEFCDEYEKALNRVRWLAVRVLPLKPKYHGGRHLQDYWTCSACGKIVEIHDDFCRGCGREIKWDGCRTLTGVHKYKEMQNEKQ